MTSLVVALSILVSLFLVVAPPHTLLGKAEVVGYAICHQIPERSFILGGHRLPLCARCTGTFLGAVLGLTAMLIRRRGRASLLPPVPVLAVLVIFVGMWAFDGLNSYMTLFPGAPHLYEPRNWLRLLTGLLNGLALITFVFPIFNFTLWRKPTRERVIRNLGELAVLLPVVALLVFVIQAELSALLYPLALLSSLGVVLMLAIINAMIATIVLGREGYATTWKEALVPLTTGTALALVEMAAIVVLRDYLTRTLGMPF
ncbi:DUF2085 domain-containing protein [Chloroflexota bacterium]